MSVGFSVGDFIAVHKLANDIRQRFVDAPEQFKAISAEVRSLSIILEDIKVVLPQRDLTDEQKKELSGIADGCHNVLGTLNRTLEKYQELSSDPKGSEPKGFRLKIRRGWKRLRWEPEDIKELRVRIISNISLLNAFNGQLTSEISQATKDGVNRLHERQDNRERREERQIIFDWLTPIDYAPWQSDFIARRQEGTGQWLLDSDEFQEWVNGNKKTLFCPGMPGAGKTIMTSIIVEHLWAQFQDNVSVGIAYLYCNFRRQHEQKPADLLASLLKQLVQEQFSMPEHIKSLYERHKSKRTRPSFDEISKTLHSVVTIYSKAFIIIDALDECQVSDGSRKILLSEIFNLQRKTGANFFATSRIIPDIMKEFEGSISLDIRASDEDVRRYIEGRISRLPSRVIRSHDLQRETEIKVIKAVDGMFLLAQLHLDSLIDKTTPRAIRHALEKLPKGLDQAYQEAMKRIQSQETGFQELAKRVLLWITCAKRSLTTLELRHALAVEIGDLELGKDNLQEIEDIVSVCAGLVAVDEQSDIIRLVHYTTQEYFERTWISWFPNAQRDIATTCVTYLSFDCFKTGFCPTDEKFEARLQLNPLYDYAARNWGHHAHVAMVEAGNLILDFLMSEAKTSGSSQAMMAFKRYLGHSGYSQSVPKQMGGVHLAAYFGLKEPMTALLKNEHDPDSKDTYGRTALSWAAENGHEVVVKQLLEKGAELESKSNSSQTPLSLAAENGRKAVVELLLKGAELESKDNYGRTPLSLAAARGHKGVVKQLLEKGAELESKDKDVRTPLSWAAANGHETVVMHLFEKGAELESKAKYGRTPLLRAVYYGNEAVVKLLLEKGAELESKDEDGRTPLSWAAVTRHKVVVKLLLEKGAKLESKDEDGRTPLSWATEFGHKDVVKLLLEKDAELEFSSAPTCPPLSNTLVKQQLEKGAELECKDSDGLTPLLLAAKKGHKAVVTQLLEMGAELESKDSDGLTPLSCAAYNGYEAVVKLLLENGAELEPKDKYGQTPLSWAIYNGHEAVVELLLNKGAEISQ